MCCENCTRNSAPASRDQAGALSSGFLPGASHSRTGYPQTGAMPLLEQLTTAVGDRYRVERELGRGGMAVVFLAEDLKHHRLVALKVLKPELSVALGGERFLREIEIAAALQHPHILPLYDSGQVVLGSAHRSEERRVGEDGRL